MGTKTLQQYQLGIDLPLLLLSHNNNSNNNNNNNTHTNNNNNGKCESPEQVEDRLLISMDKSNRPQFEHQHRIKTTMLSHEQLFKQQVKELHRLYRVQRMLMDEMKSEIKLRSTSRSIPSLSADHHANNQSNFLSGYGFQFNLRTEEDHRSSISIPSSKEHFITNCKKGLLDVEYRHVQPQESESEIESKSKSAEARRDHLMLTTAAEGPSRTSRIISPADDVDCCGVDLTLSIGSGRGGGSGAGGASKKGYSISPTIGENNGIGNIGTEIVESTARKSLCVRTNTSSITNLSTTLDHHHHQGRSNCRNFQDLSLNIM